MKKLNFTQWVLVGFAVLILVGIGVRGYQQAGPGQYDEFAQCLTEQGVVKYGADTCPVCARQKTLFGKSFKYVNYVRCELRENAELCQEEKIEGYPTWKIHKEDGTTTRIGKGLQQLEQLAEASGCELDAQ